MLRQDGDLEDGMLTYMLAAWWIAFGPHGPRAEAPPGEWGQIWLYTAIGVGASAVLFLGIHSFARPPPRTMTKEWQEATNEYLKVCPVSRHLVRAFLTNYRENESILSMVSAAKAMMVRALFRANLQSRKALRSRRTTNRRFKRNILAPPLLQNFGDRARKRC